MGRVVVAAMVVAVAACAAGAVAYKTTVDDSPTLHTTGMTLTVELKDPAPQKLLVDLTGVDGRTWRADLATGGQPLVTKTFAPGDFAATGDEKAAKLYPLAFYQVTAVKVTVDGEKDDGIAAVKVAWVNDDKTAYAWESDPAPVGKEEGLTWWPGAHRDNAGHFAFRIEPNGLLINNVNFNSIERAWYYFKPRRDEVLGTQHGYDIKESFQFNYRIPGAQEPTRTVVEKGDYDVNKTGLARRLEYVVDLGIYANDEVQADWTSVRWRRKVKTEGGKQYTQELRYGTMAVGVQVETDSSAFELSFQDQKDAKRPSAMVVFGEKGARVVKAGENVDPKAMGRNFVVLLAEDGTPEIPVLVVFQKRPQRFEWTEGGLVLHRDAGVGTLALATPFGATVLPATTAADWAKDPSLLPTERLAAVANLLMAYPWKCTENFAVDGGWVRIRDRIEFLPWEDEWGMKCQPYAPLPPLVSYSIDRGYIPRECVGGVTDMNIPTKWGPYRAKPGEMLEYRLPIPEAWDYFPLVVEPTEATRFLAENLERSVSGAGEGKLAYATDLSNVGPGQHPHAAAHDFSAGGWRASNFMADDVRERFRALTCNAVLGALFPQNYRLRRDPIVGVKYLACTSWGAPDYEPNGEGLADIDYWQGLTIYGIYTNAKYASNWETMAKYWPVIRSTYSYWEALHSWVFMGPGAREAGEMYHGDMATAGYAGLVGFYRLASRLGTPFQKDESTYFLTKNAVAMAARFGFNDWAKQLPHQELREGALCNGFGERWVASFNVVSPDVFKYEPLDPWWRTGCIGPQSAQPETLDLFMRRCRDDLVKWETQFIKLCPNEGLIKHDDIRVMPHVMLRTYLGGEMPASALDLLRPYQKHYLLRDAHVAAGLLAWDCPVRLVDWSPAYIKSGRWDEAAKTGRIRVETTAPAEVKVAVTGDTCQMQLDGKPTDSRDAGAWADWRLRAVSVPAGEHELVVVVKKET